VAAVSAAGLAVRAWGRRSLDALAAFALPQRCPGCGAPAAHEALLCADCRGRIPRLAIPLCVRCLVEEREPASCTRHRGRAAWAAWVYDERAALLIAALKFGGRPGLAAGLGATIAAALPPGFRPDLVLEVPLHPARRRERGYNQAALLADAVAGALGAPRLDAALVRTRATREQAGLGPAARRANPAAAFAVRDPRALEGRSVLIVDDVLTTGSTLEACLAPLAACGAAASAAVLAWAS